MPDYCARRNKNVVDLPDNKDYKPYAELEGNEPQYEKGKQVTDIHKFWYQEIEKHLIDKNRIGSGGFGTVYKVLAGKAGEFGYLACKKFDSKMRNEVRQVLSQQRELVFSFKHSFHPNLVRCFGFLVEKIDYKEEVVGYMMELMYCSLDDALHRNPSKFSSEQNLSWMVQAANALVFLHEKKIIHRDVKPKNMVLSENLTVLKVCDFGLTREIRTSMTGGAGTPQYMAPEVMEDLRFDEKADVYSYAISAWEILTKKKPYKDFGDGDYLKKIPTGTRPPLQGIEPEMIELLNLAWDTDPSKRPSMAEVLSYLNTGLTNRVDHPNVSSAHEIMHSTQHNEVGSISEDNTSRTNADISLMKEKIVRLSIVKEEKGSFTVSSRNFLGKTVCQVTTVKPGTSTHSAGLLVNDILVRLNGQDIVGQTKYQLKHLLDVISVGQTAVFHVARGYPALEEKKSSTAKRNGSTKHSTNTASPETQAILNALTTIKKSFAEISQSIDQLISLVPKEGTTPSNNSFSNESARTEESRLSWSSVSQPNSQCSQQSGSMML